MSNGQEPVEQLDGQMTIEDGFGGEATDPDVGEPNPEREIEHEPVGDADLAADAARFGAAPSGNPNPARIPDPIWWLWLRLHELEPGTQLGGIYADKSGYHNTRDRNRSRWPGNYSIRESEDLGGPADKAAAFDWTFPDAQAGRYATIAKYTQRLLASGRDRNDPRLDGLREFYGQADTDRGVEGWDCRHLYDITSDSSHLWHIHLSFDRDKVLSYALVDAVFSVLRGETVAEWRARTGTAPAPEPPPAGGHQPGSRTLRLTNPLMEGADVEFVQRWIGPARCGAADGVFGPHTSAGVVWYQRMRGIAADGEVGPQTWRQMGVRT
jgi:peptidoglycan hydrolase-like protein with peptidoglycan-binding domain